ncbi:hypothetical protein Tco_1518499, partial [Tanacetum coccineum]
RGKSEVPTTQSFSTASGQVTIASTEVATATFSRDTICAYIATQQSGSQIKYEDITQIDDDDIEEMDIKWNMALLIMRADRAPRSQDRSRRESYKKDPKSFMAEENEASENQALVAEEVVPTEFDLMAMSSSSSDNEVYDDSYCSKSYRKNTENLTVNNGGLESHYDFLLV